LKVDFDIDDHGYTYFIDDVIRVIRRLASLSTFSIMTDQQDRETKTIDVAVGGYI
jgi:hypothetical protein